MRGLRFKVLRFIYKRKLRKRRLKPLSETDSSLVGICKNVIRRNDSKLFYFPNSNDRYVINNELELIITLKNNRIDICNHQYRYLLDMRDDAMQDIIRLHNQALECSKREMEKAMGDNINQSLRKLLLVTEVE